MPTTPLAPPPSRRLSNRRFDSFAAALAFLTYFIVFSVVRGDRSLADAALSSLINLLPLLILAAAARAILQRYVIGAALARQLAAHLLLASAFTMLWYWLLMVLMGVRSGGSFTEFVVRAFFPSPVFAWQILQGVAAYSLVAALTYMRAHTDLPSFLLPAAATDQRKDTSLTRYFIRRGDDIYPVDVSQIVSIVGADDYAEVATLDGRHLVRTTLAEFEASLDPANFLRIHRSRIVNLHQIARAEPAGDGRMLLHMQDGEMVQTSRGGAKLLRERVI